MDVNIVQNILQLEGLSKIVTLFLVVVLAFYFIFTFLVVRQVGLLNRSFKTDASFMLSVFSYAHMIATAVLLLIALVTLI